MLFRSMVTGQQTVEFDLNATEYANTIVVWGMNWITTKMPDAHWLTEARIKGTRVVVIACEYSATATKGDDAVVVAAQQILVDCLAHYLLAILAQMLTQIAKEVRRLAPAYYIQTPSRSFPIEAHTMLPFWWLYPKVARRMVIGHWRKSRPAYADFIEGTTAPPLSFLKYLFPDGKVSRERFAGMVKSYILYRPRSEALAD